MREQVEQVALEETATLGVGQGHTDVVRGDVEECSNTSYRAGTLGAIGVFQTPHSKPL